jgi:adenosylmethionine-8-amino-7-oxononanoate aminotransferase
MKAAAALLERGFLTGAIRPPSVPAGGARLRITVSAAHTEEQIDALIEAMSQVLRLDGQSAAGVSAEQHGRGDHANGSGSANSASLPARDAVVVWHPYTQHRIAPPPIAVVAAEGAHLITADGRRILDGISSWWVTLHGHGNSRIAAAIARQATRLEQVIFAGFTHEPAVKLAEELTRITPPGLARVFYSDNGSTAVEVAIKMALQYWRNRGENRATIVALEGAYHGDTFGAMSVSERGVFTQVFADFLFDVERLPDPGTGDIVAAFTELLERDGGGKVAGIIVEPLLQGAGGMKMWSAATLRALRDAAESAGVLFIADEVLTGFGRTGPAFACDAAGITPDIMCLSKGLTGGFLPMGATLATERIFNSFLSDDRRATFFHGHSYTANPLACAAALASIAQLDDTSAARRCRIEELHREWIHGISAHPRVRDARVLGTVAAFDIEGDAGYLSGASARLAQHCLSNDVLVRPLGNVVYLMPPYCVEESDLRRAHEVIAAGLDS